jgi:hypothetical protein
MHVHTECKFSRAPAQLRLHCSWYPLQQGMKILEHGTKNHHTRNNRSYARFLRLAARKLSTAQMSNQSTG